jgi:competence protein ComEC
LLREFPVGMVLGPGIPAGTGVFLDALEAAREGEVPWRTVSAGDSLNLDGMALRVLAPPDQSGGSGLGDSNAASVVLELLYGEFSALLTGDAPVSSERVFHPSILSDEIDVLKVGHHGSSTSTSPSLVRGIRPQVALISVGRRNRFGHPAPEVLRRLLQTGARIYRTDRGGDLIVRGRKDGSMEILQEHPEDFGTGFERR